MCGHYSVEWYTHGTLLLGATHLSLINLKYLKSLVTTNYLISWVNLLEEVLTEGLGYHNRLSHGAGHVARGLIPSTWDTDRNRGGLHNPDTS